MSSAAQFNANAQNAQSSTGPRTEEGKARSSQNAIKHGLTSNKALLLPDEDEEEFRQFEANLKYTYAPANHIEVDLVDDIISIQWRRKRAAALEARILSAENPDFKALNNISLIANRSSANSPPPTKSSCNSRSNAKRTSPAISKKPQPSAAPTSSSSAPAT